MIPVWLPDSVTADLDRALHYTALWGFDGIELRVVDGPTRRVPHVNEKRLRNRLEETEMDVASVLPELFEGAAGDRMAGLNDVAALPETVAFARRVGAPLVVAPAFARADGPVSDADLAVASDAVRRAAEVCLRAGLRLALAHGPATAFPRAADLARLLDAADAGTGSSGVQAVWSPVDGLLAGESPEAGHNALAGRIALVRVRDGKLSDGGDATRGTGALRFVDTEVGAGSVDWTGIVRALAGGGFSGPLSLDVRAEPKARTGLRSATALIAAIRAARRATATASAPATERTGAAPQA